MSTYTLIWIWFVAAQIADILSTNAFRRLGIAEAHPLWRWMQEHAGAAWWIPRLASAVGLALVVEYLAGSILPVAVIAGGITAVVVWNLWQIRRARG